MKMPWYLRISNTPFIPPFLVAGSILVIAGQPGFGQIFISIPLLLGLSCGRLLRVDRELG